MHKVEQLNDHGDWMLKSWHRNLDHAQIICEVCEQAGNRARIVLSGKVVYETPEVEKRLI
jgi:hypothetical protein